MKIKSLSIAAAFIFSAGMFAQNEAPVAMSSAQYESENFGEFASSSKVPADPEFVIFHDNFVTRMTKTFFYEEFSDPATAKSIKYYNGNAENADSVAVIENYYGKFLYLKKNGEWTIDKFKIEQPTLTLDYIQVGSPSKQVYERLKYHQFKKVNNGQIWIVGHDEKKHIELTFVNDKIVLMQMI